MLYAGYRFQLRRAAEQALAAVRAAGFPVTFAELGAWNPEIAGGPNAALLLEEAGAKVKDADHEEFDELRHVLPVAGDSPGPGRGQALAGEELAAVEKYLSVNEEALRLLHAAAALEPCRFPGAYGFDLWSGGNTRLLNARSWFYLLQLDGLRQAAKGEAGKAAAAVAALLRAGRAVAGEPLTISLLVGRAGESMALSTLECALSTATLPAAEMETLAAAVARAEEPERLRRTMIGERAFIAEAFFAQEASALFSASIYPGGGDWTSGALGLIYRAGGFRELDLMKTLELFERLIDAAALPLPERHPAAKRAAEEATSSSTSALVHAATRILGLSIAGSFGAETQAIAHLRAARAALAAERCRLKRGKLPERLEELVPEFLDAVPTDPFDGKPIRWKLFPWGYTAYSVGPDKTDDGGAEFPAAGEPVDEEAAPDEDAESAAGEDGSEAEEPERPLEAKARGDDIPFIVERQ